MIVWTVEVFRSEKDFAPRASTRARRRSAVSALNLSASMF
jgi:hypothetical protein